MKELNIIEADLSNKKHTDAILHVTNEYAKHPMGLGKPLPKETQQYLRQLEIRRPQMKTLGFV